ncbi:MAG: hypothetical protein AB7I41_22985 [Candidatus Sericytochromatia bacterium]
MTELRLNGNTPGATNATRPTPAGTGPLSPALLPEAIRDPRPIVDALYVAPPQGTSLQNVQWLQDPLATVSAHFRVRDIDGLDQRSRSDLHGQLDANLSIKKDLLARSIDYANAQNPDFKFEISYNAETGGYKVPVAYKTRLGNFGLGSVYIKPNGGKLEVSFGGLAGGLTKVANFLSFGTLKGVINDMVQDMSKNMGFKVSTDGATEFVLEPDLQNSPLMREFPLAGGEKLKLESVNSGSNSLVQLSTDADGTLQVKMTNLNVVASTGPGGAQAVADREGPDQMDLKAQAQLNRDLSTEVNSELDLSLDVQASEKAGLQARIKALTGKDLPVSGKVSIQDLKVKSRVEANGQVSQLSTQGGRIQADNAHIQMGSTEASLKQMKGEFNLTQQGPQTRLEANQLSLSGQFKSPQGQLNLQNLSLSGAVLHNQAQPQNIQFQLAPGKKLTFSGNLQQGQQKLTVQGLSLENAHLNAQMGTGLLELVGNQGKLPVATVQKITLPGTELRNIQLTGSLKAGLNQGSVEIDAKSLSLTGQAGPLRLDALKGSGKIQFDPSHGLRLENASFQARGQASGVGINKLNGKGSLSVSPTGQIQLTQVTGLDLKTDQGLSLKGSFKGQVNGQEIQLQTTGKEAARVDFKPKQGNILLQGASLSGAQISGNLDQGNLLLQSRAGQKLQASISQLKLPGVELSQLSLKGGQLTSDIAQGTISLQSLPQQPMEASAGRIQLPNVDLKQVQLKGNFSANTQSGEIAIDAQSFALQGQIGDLQIETLSGKGGKAQISPQGKVVLQDVLDAHFKSNIGVEVKGSVRGEIHGQTLNLETQGSKATDFNYLSPDGRISMQGVQVQGRVEADFGKQEMTFTAQPNSPLKLSAGRIDQVDLKQIEMSNGVLKYTPQALRLEPLPNATLKASGEIEGVKFSQFETTGPVVFDQDKQEIVWQDGVKAALPDQGIQALNTAGPMRMKTLPSGELMFSSQGGVINASIGQLKIENLKTEGQVIFNPATGQLRFAGEAGKPMSIEGSFNGKLLKLSSSGQVQIQDTGSHFRITGQDIRVSGLVDGFTLDTPQGAAGSVTVNRDFGSFELQDLNFGFQLDDVSFANGGGGVRTTPDGLEITLNGALGADKGQLKALLSKLSSRPEFGVAFQNTMGDVNQALDKAFADFKDASLNFENLTLKLNHDGSLKSFCIDNNSLLHNAQLEVDLMGKKRTLPMGDVRWTAQVEGDSQNVRVPQGRVGFSLNPDLRQLICQEIKQQLEESGLKKVKLEMLPDGKVKILNATLDGKVIDISAKLEISTQIIDKQLVVSLDKVNLKNFLLNIVGKIANAPDKVADQVDQMLSEQKIKYQRRNRKGNADPEGGRVFAIDLQALMQRIDPQIQLKAASLDPQGQIQIDYSYSRALH